MDSKDAARLHRRAIASAKRFGFADYSEDIAQEVLLNFAEGNGRHQTINQAVIDVVRRYFGRPGEPGFARRHALATAGSLTDDEGNPTVQPRAVGDVGAGLDFDRIAGFLQGADRMIIILRFKFGLSEDEIADLLEVTASRISQRIQDILMALKTKLNGGPLRRKNVEKLKFDKDIGVDLSDLRFDPDQMGWLQI